MTTLMIVDGRRTGESRSQVIARRIKGEIAQNGLSMTRAADLVGMTQSKFSRRMTGNVDFGVQELDMICDRLDISFEYVTSGIRPVPSPGGPDGGPGRSRPGESNPRPSHYKATSNDANGDLFRSATVTPLPVRSAPVIPFPQRRREAS